MNQTMEHANKWSLNQTMEHARPGVLSRARVSAVAVPAYNDVVKTVVNCVL